MPDHQKAEFESALRRISRSGVGFAFSSRTLASLGESFHCYVPRLLRELEFGYVAGFSYMDVTSYYTAGSRAIGDLIRLLERISDEVGVVDSHMGSATTSISSDEDSVAGGSSIHGIPPSQGDAPAQVDPLAPKLTGNIQIGCKVGAEDSGLEHVRCANDPSLRTTFESLRQVLHSHSFHPLLNEELREFLEPEDSTPPTKFLGHSVREVFEIPFERLAASWVGRDRLECLLRMLDRAVRSVHSSEGEQEEGRYTDETALRPRANPAPRELHVDEKSWRAWTDAIHSAGLHRLKLGTVAECLRDLSSGLWDQPLSHFTTSRLSALATIPGVGPKRVESVVSAVRNLGAELVSINFETSICLRFIPGPLRSAQEWIEQILEARLVPDIADLAAKLVRPLAWQLRHDLPERESQIAIHRLQLDDSPNRSTLEELSAFHGITRERIRQLEQWGPRVLKIRFPQGRYLLEGLYGQLSTVTGAEPQARVVRRVANLCFESEIDLLITPNEVSVAWEEAARLKITPMTSEQITDWSLNRLPMFSPYAVLDAVRSQSLSLQLDGRPVQWFSRTEIDRILYTLSQQRAPIRLEELVLFDRVQNEPDVTASHLARDLSIDDERSLWGRIRRDPRFVECGDHHLLLPAEGCGFERVDGKWMVRLISRERSNPEGERKLSIVSLGQLIVDGLSHRGIADATFWGVHRFANEIVEEHFHLRLADSMTPHALADMLMKTSDGLIRSMRRRRLRWDHESLGIPARGKRGWVGHVVTECGHPMLLDELACRLRDQYQDYADYVVNQLTVIADEDGEIDNRAQFLTGFGHRVPVVVLPTNWKGDSSLDSVSIGVANLIRRLARQVRSERLGLGELNAVDWLKSLVAEQLSASVTLPDDEEDEPQEAIRESKMYPINITRIGTSRQRLRIPAFVVLHGENESQKYIRLKHGKVICEECKGPINELDHYVVQGIANTELIESRLSHDSSLRCWCLLCIEYERIPQQIRPQTTSSPVLPFNAPSLKDNFDPKGLLKLWAAITQRPPLVPQVSAQRPRSLDADDLANLHGTSDAARVLSADLKRPIGDLLGYTFGRILACVPKHRPWSLAELRLSVEDVDWLKALFERATASAFREVLYSPSPFNDYSREAQLGAVLLLLESELARRHASEGMLWSAIHQQIAWMTDANRFLFNHRQPNSRHKALLEAAARELGLRCAFGEDSAQEWYQSVFLQFGFSKKSFESRLPEWLIGQNTPVSVTRLLGSDTRYASDSFATLWRALREYRQGSLDRSGLKTVLESSPWVLQEWHESLLRLARAESGASNTADGQSRLPSPDNEDPLPVDSTVPPLERRFLSEPRLRLSNQILQFTCNVEVTDSLELEDDADVVINGQVQSRLILQADGSFDATPSEIVIPTSSPKLISELRTCSGVTVATQELTLWDDDEDVAGFVIRTGRPVDPWNREFSQRETLLIYSADLRIEPARSAVVALGNGTRVGVRLLPQEAINTRLFLGNELLWEPDAPTFPRWRENVRANVELRPRESPKQFRICVSHPSEVTVTAVRFRRQLLDLTHDSTNRASSAWFPLDVEIRRVEAISFTVLLRSGDEKTELRRRDPLRLPGHLWRKSVCWEEVASRATLELRELRTVEFRLSPPESAIKGEQWQLFEGRRWIDSVKGRPQRISGVEGWGAPVILRAATYNCCEPEQPLLNGLTDHGEIREVELCPDGAVTIQLHRPIAPDESHTVVLLDDRGSTRIIEWTELCEMLQGDVATTSWTLPPVIQANGRRIMALAIAYAGERLGSWWQHDWSTILGQPASRSSDDAATWASDLADALRWFHLPLLSREESPRLSAFVNAFAVPVLSAWMTQRRSRRLVQESVGEGWLSVVRAVFSDWLPSVEEAQKLDEILEPALSSGTDPRLMTTTLALADISSLLTIRFVRARLKDDAFESAKIIEIRTLLEAIRMRVLGRDSEDSLIVRVARDVARTNVPPDGTLDFVRDSLLAKCLHLISHHESPEVTDLDRCNIEVAMRLEAFRKLGVVAGVGRLLQEFP
jgi:hypothetical protein